MATSCKDCLLFTCLLSLLHSAKAIGANPYDYLHDVYSRIMAHPANRLDELLPAAWLRARS